MFDYGFLYWLITRSREIVEAIFLSNGTGQDRKAFHHASAEPQSLFGSVFTEGDRYATLPPNLIMYHVPCPPKGAVPPLIQCSALAKLWYSRSCRKTLARGEEGRGVSFPESIKKWYFWLPCKYRSLFCCRKIRYVFFYQRWEPPSWCRLKSIMPPTKKLRSVNSVRRP